MILAKKVTIFEAQWNTTVAWDVVLELTVMKIFRHCGIHEHMAQQQETLDTIPTPTQIDSMTLMCTSKPCLSYSGMNT